MEIFIIALLAVLIGLGLGTLIGFLGRKSVNRNHLTAAEKQAASILEEAKEGQRLLVLEAKEKALRIQSERDSEHRER